MTRMENRKKGYIGTILDGKKLADIANQIYALQYGDEAGNCTVDDLLLIELAEKDTWGDPKYAVVCTEGVGWEQDSFHLISVPTNVGDMSSWNGKVQIAINVIKSCVTEQTQDIAEYVRVFGSQGTWHHTWIQSKEQG